MDQIQQAALRMSPPNQEPPTQLTGKPLQEFVVALKQLVHWDHVGLPMDFIQREAAHVFIGGLSIQEVKNHLLMCRGRSLNEALNQTLNLEAPKAAVATQSRLTMGLVTRVLTRMLRPPAEHYSNGRSV